jgi:phage terminase large subunit GpA-like protein
MTEKRKRFRVSCPHCEKSFNVRYGVQDIPDDKQPDVTGDVAVDCLHCGKPCMIKIPRQYIERDHMVRGVRAD